MSNPKDQKTAILSDTPPEVQAALNRQGGGGQQAQKTMALDASGNLVAPTPSPQPSPQPAAAPAPQSRPAPRQAAPAQKAVKKSSGAGRWIAGPLISAVIAVGTAALAGVLMPPKPKAPPVEPKVMGKLRLSTDPPGAAVTIDGKPFPHFTPTEVEGDVGSTLRVGFKLDGYQPKEEEVVVGKGEHPFNAKLEVEKKVEPPPPPPAPVAAAPAPAAGSHHEHHGTAKPVKEKEPAGKGTISVFVRPWAIVYVDGTRLRQTPVQAYELPAGKHNIELANDGKGKREKIPVVLKPGESQEIRRDWDK